MSLKLHFNLKTFLLSMQLDRAVWCFHVLHPGGDRVCCQLAPGRNPVYYFFLLSNPPPSQQTIVNEKAALPSKIMLPFRKNIFPFSIIVSTIWLNKFLKNLYYNMIKAYFHSAGVEGSQVQILSSRLEQTPSFCGGVFLFIQQVILKNTRRCCCGGMLRGSIKISSKS